ncbi:uncharacterized protein C8Q71DRAFT_861816 [Rhodofomes roseus]|uniref:Uncharacterized protein n=1 Tax=Rhodofomes roseus TaxID=34475 RepID=A0ABQ8K3Q5_9APHY|nr:uncharacterized protein C8Q71DRAFT_861816 [Rhodofomes roseus]KAH9831452.1 hypothetical protein C8Q71DRAFT_861816 [Rhodofomes roseus]
MHISEYDYLFKLLLIGDFGVGKRPSRPVSEIAEVLMSRRRGRDPNAISITLEGLIDPTAVYWQELHKKSAVRSLEEELEFYELLDMDAEGETDNTGENGAHS